MCGVWQAMQTCPLELVRAFKSCLLPTTEAAREADARARNAGSAIAVSFRILSSFVVFILPVEIWVWRRIDPTRV